MKNGLMLPWVLIATLLCTLTCWGVAQRVIVNGNGERVIMYPDGSWRLAEAGDSILLRQNLQKSEALTNPSSQTDDNSVRNPGEEQEYVLRQWNELYFKIKEQEKKALAQFRNATNAQFKAGEQLQNAEANKKIIESDRLAALHENYEKAIGNLRTAKLRQKVILKLSGEAKKISGQSPSVMKKKFAQINNQFTDYLSTYDPNHSMLDLSKSGTTKVDVVYPSPRVKDEKSATTKNRDASSKTKKNRSTGSKEYPAVTKSTESISSLRTLSQRLPPALLTSGYVSEGYKCIFTLDTVDAETRTHRVALERGLIFTDTDPDLRPYFKNKELITCYGRLSKIGAYLYFNMDIQIASSHSQGNFGTLESGSLLRLRLLNGKYVSLYNLKSDRGRIDPYSGNTIFSGQYALGKEEIKLLTSSPLDKIRILWGTGYEDYDVYKIDFFINQLHCLYPKN